MSLFDLQNAGAFAMKQRLDGMQKVYQNRDAMFSGKGVSASTPEIGVGQGSFNYNYGLAMDESVRKKEKKHLEIEKQVHFDRWG